MPNRLTFGVIFLAIMFSSSAAWLFYNLFFDQHSHSIMHHNKVRFIIFFIQHIWSLYRLKTLINIQDSYESIYWLFQWSTINLFLFAFGQVLIVLNHGRLFGQVPPIQSKTFSFQINWLNLYLQITTNFLMFFVLSGIGLIFLRYQMAQQQQRFQLIIDHLKSEDYVQEYEENKFQSDQIHQKKTCSICLDHLTQQRVVKLPKCKHYFHKQCLIDWLKRSSICPLCRNNISQAIGAHEQHNFQQIQNI